jgi:hypothetical protein
MCMAVDAYGNPAALPGRRLRNTTLAIRTSYKRRRAFFGSGLCGGTHATTELYKMANTYEESGILCHIRRHLQS